MDLPMWRQFTRYMFFDFETDPKTQQRQIRWGAIGGNLGPTFASRGARTVQDEIFKGTKKRPSRFYYSARLGFQAFIFALVVGIPLGVLAALKQNTILDYLSLLTATTAVALGTLITGLILIIIFAVTVYGDSELEPANQTLDFADDHARISFTRLYCTLNTNQRA
jgi:oligopeptide transport system permease protein